MAKSATATLRDQLNHTMSKIENGNAGYELRMVAGG